MFLYYLFLGISRDWPIFTIALVYILIVTRKFLKDTNYIFVQKCLTIKL